MEKVALIQLCETSIKLNILNVEVGGFYNIFDSITENIKLGSSIDNEGLITAAKIAETLTILKLFRNVCDNNNVTRFTSVATSFIKDAKNQKSFFDEIYNNTGFSFNILTLDEEIRAVYSGVINYIDMPKGVIIDIEPNMTHVIHYNRRTVLNIASINLGAITLAEMFANELDLTEKHNKMQNAVLEEIDKIEFLKTLDPETVFVGTGVAFISLGKLAKRVAHYPLDVDNNYVITNQHFLEVYDKVKDLDLDKTKKLKGISEERADALHSGISIAKAFIETFNISAISVSAGGLEEGLIYNNIVPETNDKPLSDMLSYSLDNIRMFYDRSGSNTLNVYNLAIILFKQLKVMHKLPRAYVKPLRIAASMYDCGTRIGFENFSNYSFEIIVNSKLNGVSHKDLLLAGFACKAQNLDNIQLVDWIKYKDILTEEDLDAVRKLGVIINLASALDKSRNANVTDIYCDILGDSIIMKTVVKQDAAFEIRQGMKIGIDFKRVFKKFLQII